EYNIYFYETLIDAEAGTNAIPNPSFYYNSIPFNFVIYFRKDNLNDGTYEVGFLQVNMSPLPIIGQPDDIFIPSVEIDLTVNEDEITTDDSYAIAYYTSMTDAINSANTILNPTNLTVSENTTIWVVVTHPEGCSVMTSFNLIVDTDSIVNIPDTAFKAKLLQAD